MAKDTYYFQHDYNARNDDKILEIRSNYGAEGYGVFWMIIETMAENEHGGLKASLIGGLSIGFGIVKEKLLEILNFCVSIELFYEKEGFYYSQRMLKHKDFRKFLSESGREGVRIREEKKGGFKGGLSHLSSKERKGKEIKAVFFENQFAVFPDGKKQELGITQKLRLQHNDLKPTDVLKGQIN